MSKCLFIKNFKTSSFFIEKRDSLKSRLISFVLIGILLFSQTSFVFAEDLEILPDSQIDSVSEVIPNTNINIESTIDSNLNNINTDTIDIVDIDKLEENTNNENTNEATNPEENMAQSANNVNQQPSYEPGLNKIEVLKPKVDQASGNLFYEYKIMTPPGRKGIEPNLSLIYNSGNKENDSTFGYGWSLNIPYIERVNKTGTENLYSSEYFSSSVFGELVKTSNTTFAPKIERDTFITLNLQNDTWTYTDKNGLTYTFGTSTDTRQDDISNSTHIYKWMLEKVEDLDGNYITYSYTKDAGQVYPSEIVYTQSTNNASPLFKVQFETENRPDATFSYNRGFKVVSNYRIKSIKTTINNADNIKYSFEYTTGDNGYRSLLEKVIRTSYVNGIAIVLPETKFKYTRPTPWFTNWQTPDEYPNNYTNTNGTLTIPNQDYKFYEKNIRFWTDITGDSIVDFGKAGTQYNGQTGQYLPFFESFTLDLDNVNNVFTSKSITNNLPKILSRYSVRGGAYGDEWSEGSELFDINGDFQNDFIKNFSYNDNYDPNVDTNSLNQSTNNTVPETTFEKVTYLNSFGDFTINSNWVTTYPIDDVYSNPVPRAKVYPYKGIKIADLNGDGFQDIIPYVSSNTFSRVINNGNGFNSALSTNIFNEIDSEYSTNILIDLNGDGLADNFIDYYDYSNSNIYTFETRMNGGLDDWYVNNSYKPPIRLSYGQDPNTPIIKYLDINGDNLIDIVVDDRPKSKDRKTYLNTGVGWSLANRWNIPLNYICRECIVADINSDGLPDFVEQHSYSGNQLSMHTSGGVTADLLERITTETGVEIDISYQSSSWYENQNGNILNPKLPFIIQTVKKITEKDSVRNISKNTEYTYQGGKYTYVDSLNRKFAGFNLVTSNDGKTITKTYYHQGDDSNSLFGEYNDSFQKIGNIFRIETYDTSNNLLKTVVNKWDSYNIAAGHDFVFLAQQTEMTGDTQSHRDTSIGYTYDTSTGNTTKVTSYGEVGAQIDGSISTDIGNDFFTTEYTYTTGSFVKPLSESKLDTNQNFVTKKESTYNANGNETTKKVYKDQSNFVSESTTYNAFGMPSSTTDAKGNTTNYTYDTPYMYIVSKTDPLSNATSYEWNYANGKVTKTTDPNNLVTENTYDGFGRLKSVSKDNKIRESYVYTDTANASSVKKVVFRALNDMASSYTYLDGLGRVIQEKSELSANEWITIDTVYNSQGLVEKKSAPYITTSEQYSSPTNTTTLYTEYTYDSLGRVTSMTSPTGTTTYTYNFWNTTVVDPNGHEKVYSKDAYGNLVSVAEKIAGTSYPTSYGYDLNNNLIQISDAMNNLRTFTYDARGLRLSATDLHASSDNSYGTYSYTYDNNGNLTGTTTPIGTSITYTYDTLNRIVSEQSGATTITYEYDNCVNGLLKLCKVTVPNSVETSYEYNTDDTLSKETKKLANISYTTEYTYDWAGNVISTKYPNTGIVTNTLNKQNLINTIIYTDPSLVNTTVISSTEYSPTLSPKTITYGNGTKAKNTFDDTKSYRLTQHILEGANQNQLASKSYTYDSVGNIITITDSNKTITYSYDDLDRLLSATAVDTNNVQLWTKSYTYNILGNITNKDAKAYLYQGNTLVNNYANPHAPTKIGLSTVTYDKNGNTLTDGTHTNTWNYKNLLTQTVKAGQTTTYAYDHAGTRVKIATGGTTTYYPNKAYNFTPAVQSTDIYLGDILVTTAETTAGNTTLHYNNTDHLKSSSFGTDTSGNQEQVLEYYPYGEIALNTKAGVFDQKRKYIGQIYDDSTGLNYLNARYYDANRGQFISEDPVFWEVGQSENGKKALLNPQTLNSYSYAGNNPITYSDPDGKFVPALIAAAGALAMYAPQITSFAQSLMTPLGQVAVTQTVQDARNGNYGMVVIGALTAGELPAGKIAPVFDGLWTIGKAESRISNVTKHFLDHGSEFGAKNTPDYLTKTRDFITKAINEGFEAKIDKNNVVRTYDQGSNTFSSFELNKKTNSITPKTMFKPTNGQSYFNSRKGASVDIKSLFNQ